MSDTYCIMCCAFVFLRFVFSTFQFLWIVPVLIASSVFSGVSLVVYVSHVALFIHIVTLFCTVRSRRFSYVSLLSLCLSLPLSYTSVCVLVLSNTYCVVFLFVFVFVLCLACPMLPVSLDCPFLIAPTFFSNMYLQYLIQMHLPYIYVV